MNWGVGPTGRSGTPVEVGWGQGPGPRAVPSPRTRMRRQWSVSPTPGCPSLSAPLSREPAGLEVLAAPSGRRPPAAAPRPSARPLSALRSPPASRRAGPRSRSAPPSPMPAAAAAFATAGPSWAGPAPGPGPSRAPPRLRPSLAPPRPLPRPLSADWARGAGAPLLHPPSPTPGRRGRLGRPPGTEESPTSSGVHQLPPRTTSLRPSSLPSSPGMHSLGGPASRQDP